MKIFTFYKVRGRSMEPYVREGDYVLARKFFFWEKPREREVVLLRRPACPASRPAYRTGRPDNEAQLLCKRIAQAYDSEYTVLGDNENASTDSREFGLVPRDSIQEKVIVRIRKHEHLLTGENTNFEF